MGGRVLAFIERDPSSILVEPAAMNLPDYPAKPVDKLMDFVIAAVFYPGSLRHRASRLLPSTAFSAAMHCWWGVARTLWTSGRSAGLFCCMDCAPNVGSGCPSFDATQLMDTNAVAM